MKHIFIFFWILNRLFFLLSSSEDNVDATLDKLFDEMAFKQNDSKFVIWILLKNIMHFVFLKIISSDI